MMKTTMKTTVLGSLALLFASTASITHALPANEIETIYFSDSGYTTETGGSIVSCQGGAYRWGKRSKYTVRYSTPCNTGGLTEVHCRVDGVKTTCPANICDSELFICY